MCTEVSTWFRPSGRLSVQEVIDMYSQLLTQGLLTLPGTAQTPQEPAHT
jgi:hypothetical protein